MESARAWECREGAGKDETAGERNMEVTPSLPPRTRPRPGRMHSALSRRHRPRGTTPASAMREAWAYPDGVKAGARCHAPLDHEASQRPSVGKPYFPALPSLSRRRFTCVSTLRASPPGSMPHTSMRIWSRLCARSFPVEKGDQETEFEHGESGGTAFSPAGLAFVREQPAVATSSRGAIKAVTFRSQAWRPRQTAARAG